MLSLFSVRHFRQLMAIAFSSIFFLFALFLAWLTFHDLLSGVAALETLTGAAVKAMNTAVISLAAFELGLVVQQEYGAHVEGDFSDVLRRTVPRFISIVCVAVSLEGLLMVIKFAQLDLSGNLPYAVATLGAAAVLLLALGGFLRMTRVPAAERRVEAVQRVPSEARPATGETPPKVIDLSLS